MKKSMAVLVCGVYGFSCAALRSQPPPQSTGAANCGGVEPIECDTQRLRSGWKESDKDTFWGVDFEPAPEPVECSALQKKLDNDARCAPVRFRVKGKCTTPIVINGFERGILLEGLLGEEKAEVVDLKDMPSASDPTKLPCGNRVAICVINSHKVVVRNFHIHDIRVTQPDAEAIGIRVMSPASQVALINNSIKNLGVDWSAGSCSASDRNSAGIKITSKEVEKRAAKNDSSVNSVYVAGNTLQNLALGQSEALTIAGAVSEFDVLNNQISDVDNIGIDVIGGEKYAGNATAKEGFICGNRVYAIRCGNAAYSSECSDDAAGIYMDGGQRTRIERNCVSGYTHGIQISAEKKNPSPRGIQILDNWLVHNFTSGIHLGYSSGDQPGDCGTIATGNKICVEGSQCGIQDEDMDGEACTTALAHKGGDGKRAKLRSASSRDEGANRCEEPLLNNLPPILERCCWPQFLPLSAPAPAL